MTHSIKAFATGILFIFVLSNHSFAQDMATSTSAKGPYANTTTVEESSTNKTAVTVNPVVAAKFFTIMPAASNLQWTVNADNFWVSFLNNGQKGKASLSAKGKINYIITDCAMDRLPAAFSKAIKTQYASYHFFNAIEIIAHKTVAYQVIIENALGYITLKYTADGIEEIQEVKKMTL